jgi:hypothetical protein
MATLFAAIYPAGTAAPAHEDVGEWELYTVRPEAIR